jgi:hypothetical protein
MGAGGSVASTVGGDGKDSYTLEETKALVGDAFDQAIFDANKDATGHVTQAALLAQMPEVPVLYPAGVTGTTMEDLAMVDENTCMRMWGEVFDADHPVSKEAFIELWNKGREGWDGRPKGPFAAMFCSPAWIPDAEAWNGHEDGAITTDYHDKLRKDVTDNIGDNGEGMCGGEKIHALAEHMAGGEAGVKMAQKEVKAWKFDGLSISCKTNILLAPLEYLSKFIDDEAKKGEGGAKKATGYGVSTDVEGGAGGDDDEDGEEAGAGEEEEEEEEEDDE